MTNQPLNERYETALKSIDVQRDCASAQSYIAGAQSLLGTHHAQKHGTSGLNTIAFHSSSCCRQLC